MKLYIAFSIHGTNKFVVATKTIDNIDQLGKDFQIVPSRRPNAKPTEDGFKVHWSKLNRADGTPLQDRGWVTKRFNQLVRKGWTLVEAKPCPTH